MEINQKLLDKLAHLSQLEFDSKDAAKMIKDLNEIVAWVEKLKEVNTEGVQPLTSMSHEINVLREDITEPPLSHDKALSVAPKKDADYFRVPHVMD